VNEFRLGRREDERELRALSALTVPGHWLDLSYQRNPDYFLGLSQPDDQVLVGRYQGGALAGMAVRSLPQLYVQHRPQTVGYLGGLRIHPDFQGRFLLFEGFRLLHQLHQDGRTEEYLATVVEGNRVAEQLLVHKSRRGWPTFHPAGRLHTLALETLPGRAFPISPASAGEFLTRFGPRRDYFPCQPHSMAGEKRLWVMHQGLVGAIRNLAGCRQTLVQRYRGPLRWLWPVYNLAAKALGRPPLPAPGLSVRGAYLGYWCSDGLRLGAFEAWLGKCLTTARFMGMDRLYLGLMEDDPYLPVARRFRHRLYTSQVFRVRYQGQPLSRPDPIHIEVAWL